MKFSFFSCVAIWAVAATTTTMTMTNSVTDAFVFSNHYNHVVPSSKQQLLSKTTSSSTRKTTKSSTNKHKIVLEMSFNNNNDNNNRIFDISKPTFDLYTLRNIRGDALLRYNSLNQSEPLRINLYLIAMISLWCYPALSEAVINEPPTLPGIVVSTLGGAFSAYRFVRECKRRSRKLNKMEKELKSQSLQIKLPNNILADRPFTNTAVELRQLQSSSSSYQRRILAICGPKEQLKQVLVSVRTLRRRFAQASVLVVPIPTDNTDSSSSSSFMQEWGKDTIIDFNEVRSIQYLAEAVNPSAWIDYFRSLVGDDENENNDGKQQIIGNQIAWFGLANSGKSFGSGIGSPRLLEIFGQSLLPLDVLDKDDQNFTGKENDKNYNNDNVVAILKAQQDFYTALTTGSMDGINNVFGNTLHSSNINDSNNNNNDGGSDGDNIIIYETSPIVQEVLDQGGVLDGWDICLKDGARPEGMTISGSDVLIVSDTEAYSTAIEFPPEASGADPSATLLAVQQWKRITTTTPTTTDDDNDSTNNASSSWKLVVHQTIPWGPDTRAGATLRCDGRGCTALASAPAREWNFRGMID